MAGEEIRGPEPCSKRCSTRRCNLMTLGDLSDDTCHPVTLVTQMSDDADDKVDAPSKKEHRTTSSRLLEHVLSPKQFSSLPEITMIKNNPNENSVLTKMNSSRKSSKFSNISRFLKFLI